MRLLAFGVSNFKSYVGDHRIVLPDRGHSRTVYLFGGVNGSGKTSLAQAVALALHGERAAGLPGLFPSGRDARKHYQRWLQAAFNDHARTAGEDHMKAWVQVADNATQLTITRAWWFDAAGAFIEEIAEVREDTRTRTNLYLGDEAQALIDEVLPRHLLDFAIFDGEQVRRLDDTLSAVAVRAALDRLLNLGAVERTRLEIARLSRERHLAMANNTQMEAYEALCRQFDLQSAERAALAEELRNAEDTRERMQRELDQLATAFDAALSSTSNLDQMSADLVSLKETRNNLRARLGRHLSEWLYLWPAFDLLPKLSEELVAQREQRSGHEHLKLDLQSVEALTNQLVADQNLHRRLGAVSSEQVHVWLLAAIENRRSALDGAAQRGQNAPLSALSDADLVEIDAALGIAHRDMTDVRELAMDLCRIDARIRDMEDILANADQDTTTAHLLRRRDELNVLLGKQRAITEQQRSELTDIEAGMAVVKAQLTHIEQSLSVDTDQLPWLATADATVTALDEFIAEARGEAASAVRNRMLQNLQVLLHKDSLISDVIIDPLTYVIRLIGEHGADIELPSAAEHQLAAMAFIDAMLAASDRALPIFVDTPLARLDSDHRRAVVRDFWPQLGRQVIVLSTDEEVVDELLLFAEPSLAAKYRLECDAQGRSSVTIDQYLESAAS